MQDLEVVPGRGTADCRAQVGNVQRAAVAVRQPGEQAQEPIGCGRVVDPEKPFGPVDREPGAVRLRERVRQTAQRVAQRRGQPRVVLGEDQADVPPVPGEQFIAAGPRESDLVLVGDRGRDQPRGDGGLVRVRLVQRADDGLEDRPYVRFDLNHGELGTVPLCEPSGEVGFIGGRGAGSVVSCGERMRPLALDGHARHDRG